MATQQRNGNGKPRVNSSSEILDRAPPSELEAEAALVGCAILNQMVLDEVIEVVDQNDFYDDAHRLLWLTITELHEAGDRIDTVTLVSYLKETDRFERIGGASFIARIAGSVPRWEHVTYYATLVRQASVKRQLIDMACEAMRDCYGGESSADECLERHESRVMGIAEKSIQAGTIDSMALMQSAMELIDARAAGTVSEGLIKTGFADLDDILGGLRGGHLVIVAARPGVGKSSFALNVAENVAITDKKPTLFITLEMSAIELADRLLSSMAKVNGHRMRNGTVSNDDRARIVEAAARASQGKLHVLDDASASVRKIAAHARRMKRKSGLALVIVDYLQLIDPADKSLMREQQVATMTRHLKSLARELDVPIVCLAQLNRQAEQSRDNRPRLSHLRESGAIEQDADVVIFVHREEVFRPDEAEYEGLGEFIVAKQRNGPNGTAHVIWRKEYTRFDDKAPARLVQFDQFNQYGSDQFV